MQVLRPDDVSGSHGGYHVSCRVCRVEIPVSDFPGGKVSVCLAQKFSNSSLLLVFFQLICSYYPKLKEVSEVHSGDGDAGRDETDGKPINQSINR